MSYENLCAVLEPYGYQVFATAETRVAAPTPRIAARTSRVTYHVDIPTGIQPISVSLDEIFPATMLPTQSNLSNIQLPTQAVAVVYTIGGKQVFLFDRFGNFFISASIPWAFIGGTHFPQLISWIHGNHSRWIQDQVIDFLSAVQHYYPVRIVEVKIELDRDALAQQLSDELNRRVEAIRRMIEAEANVKVRFAQEQYKQLQKKIAKLSQELERQSLTSIKPFLEALSPYSYQLEGDYLIITSRFDVRFLKNNGEIKPLPPNKVGHFYIEKFRFKIGETVNRAQAQGYHPNLQGNSRDTWATFCLGDLSNSSPINLLRGLKSLLEVGNLDSSYGNKAAKEALELWPQLTSQDVLWR